jgi:hypothetical protein
MAPSTGCPVARSHAVATLRRVRTTPWVLRLAQWSLVRCTQHEHTQSRLEYGDHSGSRIEHSGVDSVSQTRDAQNMMKVMKKSR